MNRIGASLGLVATFTSLLMGCAAADDASNPLPGSGVGTHLDAGAGESDGDVLVGPCDADEAPRVCTVHNEAGCATGAQACVAGTWSPCQPTAPDTRSNRDLLDDVPSACGTEGSIANACDPACNGLTPQSPNFGGGGIVVDWLTGGLGNLPGAALDEGLPSDCDADGDCQFDHYCSETADGGAGDCVAWNPGGANPQCGADYDVTAGVVCGDQVPICNRGNANLPMATLNTMHIRWKAAPPFAMDGCSMADVEGSCAIAVTEDLEIGRCLDVACAVPPDRVVLVDTGDGNTDECECRNNWSYSSDATCEAPTCGADVNTAEEVKVSLFMSLDISGSMAWHRDCPYDKVCSGSCDKDNCNGTCISATECSSHVGTKDKCCWLAEDVDDSRWGAAHAALEEFVQDDESAGLGVVMKFWSSGTCAASACNAVDAFADSGTCAHSPCDTTGAGLEPGCAPFVDAVCATDSREYCCGGDPKGTCTFTPCAANAGTLVKGCGGTSTPIKTSTTATCAVKGFEGCCNGTTASGANWGMSKAPCTTTTTMACRNATGGTIPCNSATAGTAPTTSLTYAAYQTTVATPSCITAWNAACVASFRASFAANNEGRDPCVKAWDDGCVAKYTALAGSTPGSSCTFKDWDAACATTANSKGAACTSTACNRPSIPANCTSAGTCPLVLSDTLPDASEDALLATLDTIVPAGGTPSAVAVEGAGDFCSDYQAAHPDERCAVVFVSDGQPNGCGNAAAVYAASAQAAASDVNVFAIGISGAGVGFMNQVAASGNTTSPFFISPNSTATADFVKALQDIRKKFSCNYRLPPGSSLSSIDVTWNDNASNPEIIEVANFNQCAALGGSEYGYYPISTDEIALCPDTCLTVEALTGSNVEIVNGCGAPAVPVTLTDAFSAGTTCDDVPGSYPKWTVMYYRADVPRGSSIEVRARTRLTAADPWRSLVDVVTITPANEVSDLAAPPSLAGPLGAEAFGEDIEIEFETHVRGGAPTMLGYEVHLTCEYSE